MKNQQNTVHHKRMPLPDTATLALWPLVEQYGQHLVERRCKPNSVYRAKQNLKRFCAFAAELGRRKPAEIWEGTSVTDKLYTDAVQASQELGIPVPNKVIPIQNTGQFVPNTPATVQPSPLRGWSGGGNDFINPQRVPPSQLFPAQPIGPQ